MGLFFFLLFVSFVVEIGLRSCRSPILLILCILSKMPSG